MIAAVLVFSLLTAPLFPYSASAASVTSAQGATISIPTSQFNKLKVDKKFGKGSRSVQVTGSNFDETVGIYLAYCVVPPKGKAPTPCGGGINMKGIGDASFWISSNPPPYGVGLAKPYKPGGRFSLTVTVSERIGKIDCRKVACAIAVRSDHLREGDRTNDLYIPISFKK